MWNLFLILICHLYLLWWGLGPIFKLSCLFSYCWALRILCIIRFVFCKYSLLVCDFSHPLDIVFHRGEVFHLNEVGFSMFFFQWSSFSILYRLVWVFRFLYKLWEHFSLFSDHLRAPVCGVSRFTALSPCCCSALSCVWLFPDLRKGVCERQIG